MHAIRAPLNRYEAAIYRYKVSLLT